MWTLVQHSAWTVNNDLRFRRAVEGVRVATAAEERKVRRVGGVLLSTYALASGIEYDVNYPASNTSFLIPRCEGTFAKARVDGAAVYVPTQRERDAVAAADSERRLAPAKEA